MHRLLRGVLALALLSLLGGVLWLRPPLDPAVLHLALAVGVLPLIVAASGYFTPVLTRSGSLPPWQRAPVLLAVLAGLLIVVTLGSLPSLLPLAAAVGLLVTSWQLWIFRARARQALGSPHPGLAWYQAAFALLGLALASILVGYLHPEYWQPLRSLHLHLNLLGFVGLTAIGTLHVLLPTVSGFSDPNAAAWLKRNLAPFTAAVLITAAGAAWSTVIGGVGALGLLAMLVRWLWEYRPHLNRLTGLHGPAGSLLCAIIGLQLSLLFGVLHALGLVTGQALVLAWLYGFLLPLVTGAASHLLPLWLGSNPANQPAQSPPRLPGRFALGRGVAFLLAAVLALAGSPFAALPALLALLQFLVQCARLLLNRNIQDD